MKYFLSFAQIAGLVVLSCGAAACGGQGQATDGGTDAMRPDGEIPDGGLPDGFSGCPDGSVLVPKHVDLCQPCQPAERDCAAVCFGEAVLDDCGRCVGGTTGLKPATLDVNHNGVPDLCEEGCEGRPRYIVQFTDVPLYENADEFEGAYTFQTLLYADGAILFQYANVEPFELTATTGIQNATADEAIEFGYNSPFAREQPTVTLTPSVDRAYIADYSHDVYWYDIRDVGTELKLGDDEGSLQQLGFQFPFYGLYYNQVRIYSNGYMTFGEEYNELTNQPLPSDEVGALIAPLWDDFDPSSGGTIHVYSAPPSCTQDCNGVPGGFARPAECGGCFTGPDFSDPNDCAGVCGGSAKLDGCGVCAGGTTGVEPRQLDCAGVCGGSAFVDDCNQCVGGNTGLEPSDPSSCPQGVDLVVDAHHFATTIELDHVFVDEDDCLIQERCVQGPGNRKVIRFGTMIANVGTEDLQLGVPSFGGDFWHYDECHAHFHFEAYAAYDIASVASGEQLDIGSKNGFCVLDSQVYDPAIAPGGCVGYSCANQGITAGCADIYSAGLQCQWIDVTGLPDGEYDLKVTTNPAGEIPEINLNNNSATVRVLLQGESVSVISP